MFNKAKILTVMCLAVFGLSLTGCETLEGAGRDIENAGESVQDAAN